MPGATTAPPVGAVERLRVGFFRAFFSLLLGAIAASEWVVVARLLARAGVAMPAIAHLAAPLAFFALNRTLIRATRARPRSRAVAAYTAFAFTSVFAGVFVAAAELAWALVRAGAGGALRLAGTVPTLPAAGWEGAFDGTVDAGIVVIAALFAFGYTAGRRALQVTSLRVAMPRLPATFAGYRIVHLSDLHVGRYLDRDELRRHVERVNALEPDLVCITGDLVDRAETCDGAFRVLAGLRARDGVVVTLGNHDFAAGADTVTAALRRHTPFTVLRNGCAELRRGAASLFVVGVDDLGRDWARGVDHHPALPPLARAVPAGAPLVVLTHRPDCFDQAAALGAGLVLAGHTHGGQLGLPALFRAGRVRNLAELITRYDRGVYRRGAATLVVSNGLGFTGQPVRLFTAREIGCIELAPSQA